MMVDELVNVVKVQWYIGLNDEELLETGLREGIDRFAD